MKLRYESFGLHYYKRETGMHFLVDEVIPNKIDFSIAPRTLSIAITNDCNSNCPFCHISKGGDYLEKEYIFDVCQKFDKLGCFDIAIGGGEPLLHPDIIEICQTLWKKTQLGISITTNGILLTKKLIEKIKDSLSFLRISVDSINPLTYENIRGIKFSKLRKNILKLKGNIDFGINMVITKVTIKELDMMLLFVKEIGAEELLLLPKIENGEISLKKDDLKTLEKWINNNHDSFSIRILEQVRSKIDIPTLFNDDEYYSDYLYLSSKKRLQRNSYEICGNALDVSKIKETIVNWRQESTVFNKV